MARTVRHLFRIYDHGPIGMMTLLERAPGEPPVVEWRYQVVRWVWVNDELVEQPEEHFRKWLFIEGEWDNFDAASAKRSKLEAEWRATFTVEGHPPTVEQETIERTWNCPKCQGVLTANPPKWSGELSITCETCGQVQYVAAHEVTIDKPTRKKAGR